MRTTVFREFASLSDDFGKHLKDLWELSPVQRKELIPHVLAAYHAPTTFGVQEVVDTAVQVVGGDPAKVLRAFQVLRYLHAKWNPVLDSPDALVSDLRDLSLLPEDGAAEASQFLADFLSVTQTDNNRRLERMYRDSLLPSFKGVVTLVDLRPYFAAPFGAKSQDLESYQPVCLGFTPVVIVKISRDSGSPEAFEFQCDPKALKHLIDGLRAAEKDLAVALEAFQDNNVR